METEKILKDLSIVRAKMNRLNFIKYTGATMAVTGLMLAGCKKDDTNAGVDLGSGDTGVLNYAYALEQLV